MLSPAGVRADDLLVSAWLSGPSTAQRLPSDWIELGRAVGGDPNNGGVTTVVVSGGARSLFKIAIAPPPGEASVASTIVETAGRDFTLSSMFQVLDPKSFTASS